jgi:hypothetical protein
VSVVPVRKQIINQNNSSTIPPIWLRL